MFETTQIFGIPVYKIRIDPGSYDKKDIISTIEKNYNIGPRNPKNGFRNSDIHMSYADQNNEKYEKVNYEKLKDVYKNVFQNFIDEFQFNYIKNLQYDFDIVNYTASKNNDSFMETHNHLDECNFSCVHYLQLNENHAQTNFENTNIFAKYFKYIYKSFFKIIDSKSILNSFMFENLTLSVNENDMIIFPSVTEHNIPKQNFITDKLRITVVTNLNLKSK